MVVTLARSASLTKPGSITCGRSTVSSPRYGASWNEPEFKQNGTPFPSAADRVPDARRVDLRDEAAVDRVAREFLRAGSINSVTRSPSRTGTEAVAADLGRRVRSEAHAAR